MPTRHEHNAPWPVLACHTFRNVNGLHSVPRHRRLALEGNGLLVLPQRLINAAVATPGADPCDNDCSKRMEGRDEHNGADEPDAVSLHCEEVDFVKRERKGCGGDEHDADEGEGDEARRVVPRVAGQSKACEGLRGLRRGGRERALGGC